MARALSGALSVSLFHVHGLFFLFWTYIPEENRDD